ncbi:hypothetical protein B0T16DRAFT_507438 [Cercophora newfieldiana]|uniref:Uncharacterized protein n=1 Tax=Cercophora newfieldiana TaxID=92897 RepID=A0AA39YAX9_9PEZI|nr:hypothetical protein B0T16DRAFT_507438 [Cercophora newfieldiana]
MDNSNPFGGSDPFGGREGLSPKESGAQPFIPHQDYIRANPENMSSEDLHKTLREVISTHQASIENYGQVTLTGAEYDRLAALITHTGFRQGYGQGVGVAIKKWEADTNMLRDRLGFRPKFDPRYIGSGFLTEDDIDSIFAMAFEAATAALNEKNQGRRTSTGTQSVDRNNTNASNKRKRFDLAQEAVKSSANGMVDDTIIVSALASKTNNAYPPSIPGLNGSCSSTINSTENMTQEKTVLEKVRLALQDFVTHHKEMSGRVRKADLLALITLIEDRFLELAKSRAA